MKRPSRYRSRYVQPYLRAVMVISAVTILVTGVTFAALQSQQAVLAGNSIQTATADLKISTDGTTFSNSQVGFAFNEVIPGVGLDAAAGSAFYLKNSGTPTLGLKTAISTIPVNTDAVDLSRVYMVVSRADTHASQKFSVDSLMNSYASGGIALTDSLAGAQTAQYTLQVVMDADAFAGQQAGINGIDLVFSGTAATE